MDDKLLCRCFMVTKGDVIRAVENGAASVNDVERQTRLGFSCHACRETARKFIMEKLSERDEKELKKHKSTDK
ncbi:MAG: (2Fe-2S)-binding protein [Eubacteriales bacterium]|nr:(2Fe-2S)-binding protein [Eubacteriales bacterium]MDD3883056.1 (2Fe-2S)-binding protein [Eubacteriales bacterium]MDD4513607.1 (2Fe-2S)-binding protein [Eubacteriales bacterium]